MDKGGWKSNNNRSIASSSVRGSVMHSEGIASRQQSSKQWSTRGTATKSSRTVRGNSNKGPDLNDAFGNGDGGVNAIRVLDHSDDRTPLPLFDNDDRNRGTSNAGLVQRARDNRNKQDGRGARKHRKTNASRASEASFSSFSALSITESANASQILSNSLSQESVTLDGDSGKKRGGNRDRDNYRESMVSQHGNAWGQTLNGGKPSISDRHPPSSFSQMQDSSFMALSLDQGSIADFSTVFDSTGKGSRRLFSSAMTVSEESFGAGEHLIGNYSQTAASRALQRAATDVVQREVWSEEAKNRWLAVPTTIKLQETPTMIIFSHQDEAVSVDEEARMKTVLTHNEAYKAMCVAQQLDEGTQFQSRGVMTFQLPTKSIHVEARPPPTQTSGPLDVTQWMLHDEQIQHDDDDGDDQGRLGANGEDDGAADRNGNGGEEGDDMLGSDDGDGDQDSEMDDGDDHSLGGEGGSGAAKSSGGGKKSQAWMMSETILSTLMVMERAVVQNTMQELQLAYRGIRMDPRVRRTTTKVTGGQKSVGTAALPSMPTEKPSNVDGSVATLPDQHSKNDAVNHLKEVPGSVAGATTTQQGAAADSNSSPQNTSAAANQPTAASSTANATKLTSPSTENVRLPSETPTGEGERSNGHSELQLDGVTSIVLSNNLQYLWRFSCPITKGKNVTCMAWNRKERDLLAVGYGDFGARISESKYSGLVCCWSLKNPTAPERLIVINTESSGGVSSMAFSHHQAGLLAIGTTGGSILVFDVQNNSSVPVLQTSVTSGQHTGTVWAVKWVDRGKGLSEYLMSTSEDGRVIEWIVGKSLERVAPDLMLLKRQPAAAAVMQQLPSAADANTNNNNNNRRRSSLGDGMVTPASLGAGTGVDAFNPGIPTDGISIPLNLSTAAFSSAAQSSTAGGRGASKGKKVGRGGKAGVAAPTGVDAHGEALLSRNCGGMCVDVSSYDSSVYVVGTEDGTVHQCNRHQTEAYELDYEQHSEVVYAVRFSPFTSRYFLTCSADWTARLYALGRSKPIMTFESPNQDSFQDVAWAPTDASAFASVTAQGHLYLWEVGNTLQPFASMSYNDRRSLNCVLFAEQGAGIILMVGDDRGDITVLRLLVGDVTAMGPLKLKQVAEAQETGINISAQIRRENQQAQKGDDGHGGAAGVTKVNASSLSGLTGAPSRDAIDNFSKLFKANKRVRHTAFTSQPSGPAGAKAASSSSQAMGKSTADADALPEDASLMGEQTPAVLSVPTVEGQVDFLVNAVVRSMQ